MRLFLFLSLFWLGLHSAQAVEWQKSVLNVDDAEVPLFQLVPQNAKAQVLWLPSEYGLLPQERKIAEQLANKGLAVTLLDPYEALFLAPTPNSFSEIPSGWITELITKLQHQHQPLWIIAPNRSGVLGLSALEQLQTKQSVNHLGLILLNPNLYLNTPEPGKSADYWPQVANTNLPVSILQAELSPWRWQLSNLQNELGSGGSDVFVQLLPNLRDRFYFRPDALAREKEAAQRLAGQLLEAMHWQIPYLSQERKIAHLSGRAESKETRSLQLKAYQGKQNRQLTLQDLAGQTVDLQKLQGKVVLVNFWASWCPPCVHEMPSMAGLKSHFKNQPFEIVAVNLGEDTATVEAFNQQYKLNFPILLDLQGLAVKEWQVFAYPSSYVVDKQGVIRYALFGGTDWQEDSHVQKLESLLKESDAIQKQ